MNNEVGCLLWGRMDGTRGVVERNITQVQACCWTSPWCHWLDDEVFVFKAQRYNGKVIGVPLVIAHVTAGFQLVAGSNDAAQSVDRVQAYDETSWTPWNERTLLKMVESVS